MQRILRSAALVAILAVGSLSAAAVPASAAVKPRACSVKMSVKTPRQYSTTVANVSKVGPKAKVKTSAHYKTTTNTKKTTADSKGRASVSYRISDATPGRKVIVDVTATSGSKKWACSASFTPRKR